MALARQVRATKRPQRPLSAPQRVSPPPATPPALNPKLFDSIILGDCLEVLRALPDNCLDAIVTDPPYGLGTPPDMIEVLRAWLSGEVYTPRGAGFMGKAWDAFVPRPEYWRECLRVLKPGGHALVFAGTRTWDVMGLALRLAGFELRDTCQWIYGSGFPKSLDVSKQLDKAAGVKRKAVGTWKPTGTAKPRKGKGGPAAAITTAALIDYERDDVILPITIPATDAARQWDGWGTALKPAWEPIIVCRKPLSEPNVAANVLRWGVGALNIEASRVATPDDLNRTGVFGGVFGTGAAITQKDRSAGRWPANLLLSHAPSCGPRGCELWCPVRELDRQSGISAGRTGRRGGTKGCGLFGLGGANIELKRHNDTGGASRYFTTFRYQAKASRRERNAGCEGLPTSDPLDYIASGIDGRGGVYATTPQRNGHPTVKPLALMRWLIRLITPPGGIVLDPFAGSGSTLVAAQQGGWRYLGVEREVEYVTIARARLGAHI